MKFRKIVLCTGVSLVGILAGVELIYRYKLKKNSRYAETKEELK